VGTLGWWSSFGIVDAGVVGDGYGLEILWPIVGPVAIDVMGMFAREKVPTDLAPQNESRPGFHRSLLAAGDIPPTLR
jgi:hypothetical protein